MTRSKTKKNKRKLSSPEYIDTPVKRTQPVASPNGYQPIVSPTYVQPMNLATMNSYQTPSGAFYQPPPPHFSMQQYPSVPAASGIPQPASTQSPETNTNDNFKQVFERFNSLDKRLAKLDHIEKKLSDLSTHITSIDNRVTTLEKSSRDHGNRISDLENTAAFDSSLCDDITKKQSELDRTLKAERDRISKLEREFERVGKVHEDITDLKSRSMRNNLLFFGFPERSTAEDRRSEDCVKLLLDTFRDTLGMQDAHVNIKIERAHRIGKYDSSKKRPVVAMFNHFPDKLTVKQKFRDLAPPDDTSNEAASSETGNRSSGIRCSEQFPPVIQERRKSLIPAMIKAREDGKTAHLSYDKLFINNKMYTVDTVRTSGYAS